MNHSVISIDLAKNVFQVCVLNEHRVVILNKKVQRQDLLKTVAKLEPNRVVMEACYSSTYWGREFQCIGKEVGLIPLHHVKPFVVGNKNDANDALAIAEASLRPKTVFVAVKTFDQQDLQSIHRIRDRQIKSRTALTNQIRELLAEYGVVLPISVSVLRREIPSILEDAENRLTTVARSFIYDMAAELIFIEKQIESKTEALNAILKTNDDYQRLKAMPGIGPIVGSALIAAVGNARQFKPGRQMAAWVGLTPKLYASGDNMRMGGITKRGNKQVRKLIINGARAVVNWVKDKTDGLSQWIRNLLARMHYSKCSLRWPISSPAWRG
ncbi:MAG: IS110 family transposase [Pseudomonadales bacterium]|nr:IS110 family transposase [Pseudomonadales bacterium]